MQSVILEETIQKSYPKLSLVDAVIKKVKVRLKLSSEDSPLNRAAEHRETCTSFVFGFLEEIFCLFRTQADWISPSCMAAIVSRAAPCGKPLPTAEIQA